MTIKKFVPALFSLFLIGLIIISSCKKDNQDEMGTMTALVDSMQWEANVQADATHAGEPLNIVGRKDTVMIRLAIFGAADVGTYHMYDSTIHYAEYLLHTDLFGLYKTEYGQGGTVEITELSDERVKGTFNFTCSNSFTTITISNGQFDVPIK